MASASESSTGWVPSPPADTFAYRLSLLREDLKLTLDEIAERVGVSATSWSNWENGRIPRHQVEVVRKIADATGVDINWLMWGDGSRCYPLADVQGQMSFSFLPPPHLAVA